MQSSIKVASVAACGLATSFLVVVGDFLFTNYTGFEPFTFSVLFIIPVGAILLGVAAASGYYFGSIYLNQRATLPLFTQMVVIAGITNFAIYYFEYATLVLKDGTKASDLVSFFEYLNISLTSAHYEIGHNLSNDAGEVGTWGYWLAGIQFIGFLLGGVGIFLFLTMKPYCDRCNKYLKKLVTRQKQYSKAEDLAGYYDNVFKYPFNSSEFSTLVRTDQKVPSVVQGTINLETRLFGCPACKSQLIEDKVTVYNGKNWKDIDKLDRRVRVPSGTNLLAIFQTNK